MRPKKFDSVIVSPEEVRARTKAIRDSWDDSTRNKRLVQKGLQTPVETEEVSVMELGYIFSTTML